MQDFSGKVAVITGAGRGIGRGIALRCAQEGMKVVLSGIRSEPLEQTAADLRDLGAETLVVLCDVSVLSDVENLADKSNAHFGDVHLLVNNAGVGVPGTIWGATMDDWNWVMGVNFSGVLYGVRTFVPRMIAADTAGHIVNVSSLSGVTPASGLYGVSKHAVVALSEALYHDLAEHAPQIKVSVYCPGYVNTELDQIDSTARPRPERFQASAGDGWTDENRAWLRGMFDSGFTTEAAADVLFEGLRGDRLYIGPKAFQAQVAANPNLGDLDEIIRNRAEYIINERNPTVG